MQADKVAYYFKEGILGKFPEDIRNRLCVAGGAVRDKLLGEKIKDYDIFVDSKETEDKLMEFLKANGKEGNVNSQLANYTYEEKWVQVIRGKYWDMSGTAVIDDFDFTICQAMVTYNGGLKVSSNFYQSIATKHIMVNKLMYPLNSMERLTKYIKKGYMPCNGTLFSLAKAINDLDKEVFTPNADSAQEDIRQNTLMFYPDGTPRFFGVD